MKKYILSFKRLVLNQPRNRHEKIANRAKITAHSGECYRELVNAGVLEGIIVHDVLGILGTAIVSGEPEPIARLREHLDKNGGYLTEDFAVRVID